MKKRKKKRMKMRNMRLTKTLNFMIKNNKNLPKKIVLKIIDSQKFSN
jgi:hypothetical protein